MDVNERRCQFVYDGARLANKAAKNSAVPVPWIECEEPFKEHFRRVIEKQCSPDRLDSPADLHQLWVDTYKKMGWVYGPKYSGKDKIHPDLVPYEKLSRQEQDKDVVFFALCEIARQWMY